MRGVGPGCRPPTPRESAGKVSGAKNKNGKSSPLSERLVVENSTFLICLGGVVQVVEVEGGGGLFGPKSGDVIMGVSR